MDCLFCKIGSKEIASDLVYEDERVVAFKDISPQAPTHIILIPIDHISTLNDLSESHEALLGHMTVVASQIAKDQGIAEDGYRLVLNCNNHGGQSVYHIHMHIVGGRQMSWPPG